MSKETEDALKDWASNERDTSDDAFVHMEDFGAWDWCDIYREGIRMWNFMFDEPIADDSPVSHVFAAVAAQAADGAYASVAAALGVDVDALHGVVSLWEENQHQLPPPVSAERFMRLIKEYREWIDSGCELPGIDWGEVWAGRAAKE